MLLRRHRRKKRMLETLLVGRLVVEIPVSWDVNGDISSLGGTQSR